MTDGEWVTASAMARRQGMGLKAWTRRVDAWGVPFYPDWNGRRLYSPREVARFLERRGELAAERQAS
jgi:predicted N-acyltransferase